MGRGEGSAAEAGAPARRQQAAALDDELETPREPVSDSGKALLRCGWQVAFDEVGMMIEELEAGELADPGALMLGSYLPRGFSRHYTREFLEQFQAAIRTVGQKFESDPEGIYLESTAEELAAHAILANAESWCEGAPDEVFSQAGVTDRDRAYADIEELQDLAFEDHDVLMLFDASLDGLESSELADQMDFANLAPEDWFKPFRSAPA